MTEWEWYRNVNTKTVFLHCLFKANWKDGRFEGVVIPRGSFATSLSNLSKECNLTIQNIRSAISHLKSTGEITVQRHGNFSVVTVTNYCQYQDINTETNKPLTNHQQTSNSPLTTIEEYKNNKNIKKDIYSDHQKEVRHKYGTYKHVLLTEKEYNNLISDYGEKAVFEGIQNVDDYVQTKGKTYKDYNLVLRKWGIKSPKINKPFEITKEPEHEMTDEEWAAMYEPGGKMYIAPGGSG